jgi:hypothetical protein
MAATALVVARALDVLLSPRVQAEPATNVLHSHLLEEDLRTLELPRGN